MAERLRNSLAPDKLYEINDRARRLRILDTTFTSTPESHAKAEALRRDYGIVIEPSELGPEYINNAQYDTKD